VYSLPVVGAESAGVELVFEVVSVQLKSAAQDALVAANAQELELPKLQVVLPTSAVGLDVLNVVVPVDTNPIGEISTVLLPAGTVKAPRLGSDAGLPA
jgi:hypothetical protein